MTEDADKPMTQEQCNELLNGVCPELGNNFPELAPLRDVSDEDMAAIVKSVLLADEDQCCCESGEPKITHSLERLSHFRCGACSKWWSIGDWVQHARTSLYCPWCGKLQEVAQ